MTSSSTLDSFLTRSKSLPSPIATSQEIRDRGSTFVATIFRCSSPEQARACLHHLRNVTHGSKPASHEISAYRCMVLKKNCTGLGGPDDFEVVSASADDGEQWAGERVLRVMKEEAILDATVIVSRWFGGKMLGPVRFSHIETCATEVCVAFKQQEELDDCVSTLLSLDEELSRLRDDLNEVIRSQGGEAQEYRSPNYPGKWTIADLDKAKRLVKARENAIRSTKTVISQKKEQQQ